MRGFSQRFGEKLRRDASDFRAPMDAPAPNQDGVVRLPAGMNNARSYLRVTGTYCCSQLIR